MMITATPPKPERVFRAVSDKTRLRILNLLLSGELCVCDIVSILAVPQPTASRHLAYLRKAGLVNVRKEGVWCYYRLAPAATEFEEALLTCLTCCAEQMPVLRTDRKRLKRGCSTCP